MFLMQRPPSPPACGTPNPPFWCEGSTPTPAPIDEWANWIMIAIFIISFSYMAANLFFLWKNTTRERKNNTDYLQKKYGNDEI